MVVLDGDESSGLKLNNNNTLIETRASNFLKTAHPEVFYPMLQNMVLQMKVPEWLASKEREIRGYDEALDRKPACGYEEYEEDTMDG